LFNTLEQLPVADGLARQRRHRDAVLLREFLGLADESLQ